MGDLPAIEVMADAAIKSTWAVEPAANAVPAAEVIDTILAVDPSTNAAPAIETIEPIQAVEEQAIEDAPSISAMESSVQAAHFADKAVKFGMSGAEAIMSILAMELSSKAKPSADAIECILAMETGTNAEDTGGNRFPSNKDEGTIPSSNSYNNDASINNQISASKHDLSRRMRGLKRKWRKFSRNLDRCSGGHQKDSAFDYAAYPMEKDMPIGNVQQIRAAIAPTPKSLLKKKVKRLLKEEVDKVAELQNQNDQLQKGVDLTQKKLMSLKDYNHKLVVALQAEKKKSHLTIAQLLDDIEVAMVEYQ